MGYRVVLKPAAERQIRKVHGVPLAGLRGVILGLADDARPPGAVKLAGAVDFWRLRVRIDRHMWRIVYAIDDRQRIVTVTRVARRDEGTYRGLK